MYTHNYYTDTEIMKEVTDLKEKLNNATSKMCQLRHEALSNEMANKKLVKEAVAEYMAQMQRTGQLDGILTGIADSLKPYYRGITTVKKRLSNPATDYYVTVVPRVDPDGNSIRWRLGVANDAYDGRGKESTLAFSARKNATVCVNAGVYNIDTFEPVGTMIKDGRIVYTAIPSEDKYQYLAIMSDGKFKAFPRTTAPGAMLAAGAVDVVCIFNTLLDAGQVVEQTDDRLEPRQSIGVRADGSTVIITVDGRKAGEDAGVAYQDLAMLHLAEGCVNAWVLDGGGSNSTVVRGAKQNDDIDFYDTDRAVNSFLYIAKPTTMDSDNNAGNDIGRVKQLLVDMLVNKLDFYNGYIRLRGPENYYAPGIEMFTNAEAQRRAKAGMTVTPTKPRDSYFYISFRAEDKEKTDLFRIYDQGVYIQTYHGPSSDRPNAPIGMCFFDEGLNKPIWKGANGWVDATGASV